MAHLPPNEPPGLLCGFSPETLQAWATGAPIPERGPHAVATPPQFGFTINQDYHAEATRSKFKKGMQGCLLEERDTPQGKQAEIFIRGITEHPYMGKWIQNQWVPAYIVTKGELWKDDPKDWKMKLHPTQQHNVDTRLSQSSSDLSVLGRTITKLVTALFAVPPQFGGIQMQNLISKNIDANYVSRAIIKGIKNADLYDTLNRTDFSIADVMNNASQRISLDYHSRGVGIYLRYHITKPQLNYWEPDTEYIYVGRTTDFRVRFTDHECSQSKCGELTRGSHTTRMVAVCMLSLEDYFAFSNLAEQVFLCLFESYRAHLLVNPSLPMSADNPISYVEAVRNATFFRDLSHSVLLECGWRGAVARDDFGVPLGANYSMPLTERHWMKEPTLFVRNDTYTKDRATGEHMPIAVYRSAHSMRATYIENDGVHAIRAFQKRHRKSVYITFEHIVHKEDGITSPPRDAPFYLVFEVRTDGGPHPQAWSRLPGIGTFVNSDQARSLAARIEWEFPVNSGEWRSSYIQVVNTNVMADDNVPGSHLNHAKAISFLQWLTDAKPNHNHSWIPHMTGCARVYQVFCNLHNQTVEIGPQKPIAMKNGGRRTTDNIIADMRAPDLQLNNVDGPFGDTSAPGQSGNKTRKLCDFCSLVATKPRGDCVPLASHPRCCPSCWLFGRPCCSWTYNGAIRHPATFAEKTLSNGNTRSKNVVTPEDIVLNKKLVAALVAQPMWTNTGQEPSFRPMVSVLGLAKGQDDIAEDDDIRDEGDQADSDDDEDDGDAD
jgi:hypothetical protein